MENKFDTDLIDLASEAYGGRTLLASDDFFAPKENLLKSGRGVFIEDKYTDHGKWMDGWESRRKRIEGHDWCILRLGKSGIISEVDIDTNHFVGNFPSHASVDACNMPKFSGLDEIISSSSSFTHLRLHIYPDGGVARLRVYGNPEIPDTSDNELKDFALSDNGGEMISCSDMHFSHMGNLIKPTPGVDMSDGWETKRRRDPGYDWSILKLGSPCTIERVIVDTLHFKGNFPDSCSVEGCFEPKNKKDSFLENKIDWTEILPNSKLAGNQENIFSLSQTLPHTHIRFNIYPDGGVSRLRILGREAS